MPQISFELIELIELPGYATVKFNRTCEAVTEMTSPSHAPAPKHVSDL